MILRLAARDASILTGAVLLWWVGAGWSAGGGPFADLAGVVVGLALGLCTFIIHEWGHWLGAVATGSALEPAPSLRSPFVFSFDSRANSRGQFLLMSLAGFAGTGLAVWVAYGLLPGELLATRVARGVTLLSVGLTAVLEVPLVVWSSLSRRLPPVEIRSIRRARGEAAARQEG